MGEKTQKQEEKTAGHMESAVRERTVSAGLAGFFVLYSSSLGDGGTNRILGGSFLLQTIKCVWKLSHKYNCLSPMSISSVKYY